ncbi:hypothetical protein CDD81_7604 [Ophiocordyceps australis]|uniref:DASH complex subunit SPC34 n=1 Tax=Ophiocordyceps australis TaxID=1399860 RepID=A0A2C5XGR5_9HYPO|nr:hypothetical protein CDD81_7604 [Ophiocordyceps australis]
MSLIDVHLEQIAYSCQGIDALPFPPPAIFTNALLSKHDITTLIRDTEPHERALFSVPAPPPSAASTQPTRDSDASSRRRQTVFNVASGEVTTGPLPRAPAAASSAPSNPRRHTAVAAVLGGDMHEQLRPATTGRKTDPVDVEILLRGAEKLCGVYELPGARERIASLRTRQRDGKSTLAYYDAKVAQQAEQLAKMNKDWMHQDDEEHPDSIEESEVWTQDDLRQQEKESRDLEIRKKELQSRLAAMKKDLDGLNNM